jgi:hypothetical protein
MLKRLAAVAAVLFAAAPAAAATRYATPAGSGTTCSLVAPCGFETAVESAASGDEIVVASGTYVVSDAVNANAKSNLEIHGLDGQPRPTVQIAAPANQGSLLTGTLAHLHDIDIVASAQNTSAIFAGTGLLIEDASITATNSGGRAVYLASSGTLASLLRNVFLRGVSSGMTVENTNLELHNATVVSTGAATAAFSAYTAGGVPRTVRLRNTIAEGTSTDVYFQGADLTLNVDYSQYLQTGQSGGPTLVNGMHNTGFAPQFVSPTDLHVSQSSAGVDAGSAEFYTLAFDIDGDPRPLGALPDIGADEYRTSQLATTQAATSVEQTTAMLHGTVNPRNNTPMTWHFEYGPTAAYGSGTPAQVAGNGAADQPVAYVVTDLAAGTTYHARLVTTNHYGTVVQGEDVTLTTKAVPADSAPAGSDPVVADQGVTPTPSPVSTPTAPVTPAVAAVCVVPETKGLTRAKARAKLKQAHCRIGKARGRGRVVRQSRKAGRTLPAGTRVNLTLRRRSPR